jgi:hypothetical protein
MRSIAKAFRVVLEQIEILSMNKISVLQAVNIFFWLIIPISTSPHRHLALFHNPCHNMQ